MKLPLSGSVPLSRMGRHHARYRMAISMLGAGLFGCWLLLQFSLGVAAEPGFGTWRMTTVSGEVVIVDESRFRTQTWNFTVDPEATGVNWVRVYSRGQLDWSVAFEGVEGSPHPDGLHVGGTGRGEGGLLMGHSVVEESGPDGYHSRLERTLSGTYSDTEMEGTWEYNHTVTAGHITHTVSGSGAFTARRGR